MKKKIKIKYECAGCKKEFYRFSTNKNNRPKYCSQECYQKSRLNYEEKESAVVGGFFKGEVPLMYPKVENKEINATLSEKIFHMREEDRAREKNTLEVRNVYLKLIIVVQLVFFLGLSFLMTGVYLR